MAHQKVYAQCENMCLEETMTKEEINNTLVKKGDVVLIEETITVATDGNGILTIDFPEGFTKDNSIVLSADVKTHEDSSDYFPREINLGYGGSNFYKINPTVYLGDPSTYDPTKICISLYYGTLDQEIKKDVRVTLMKVK